MIMQGPMPYGLARQRDVIIYINPRQIRSILRLRLGFMYNWSLYRRDAEDVVPYTPAYEPRSSIAIDFTAPYSRQG